MPTTRPTLRRLLLLLGGLLLGLVLSEAVLRVAFPVGLYGPFDRSNQWDFLAFDPLLSWRNRPGYRDDRHDVWLDRRGLRVSAEEAGGRTRADESPERQGSAPLRVLCLGDSRTFGTWIDRGGPRYDNDWPRYLDAAAGGTGEIEAWNAGTLGYTTAQGLRLWRTRLRDLRPDVVVASFGFNDHALAWNDRYRVRDPSSAIARSLLYGLARFRVVELLMWQKRRPPFSRARLSNDPWVSLEDYRHNLEQLAEEARRREVMLVWLDLPMRDLSRGDSLPVSEDDDPTSLALFGARDLAHLHEVYGERRSVMREVAEQQDVPVIDVAAAFARHQAAHPDEELFGSYDLVHPTPTGARVIAASVTEKLRQIGVQPRGDATAQTRHEAPLDEVAIPIRSLGMGSLFLSAELLP